MDFDKHCKPSNWSDDQIANAVADVADEMIYFATGQLKQFQPQNDYKEFLELTIIFIGGVPIHGVQFRPLVGLHKVRWMVKVCHEKCMFRSYFKLTKREEKGLEDICVYAIQIYVKA